MRNQRIWKAFLLGFILIQTNLCLKVQDQSSKPKVRPTLKFNENHEFVILQITDLHYGESEEKDLRNDMIHRKLIEMSKPDLVVITGDSISGYEWDDTIGWFAKLWKRFTKPYEDLKIPYAYTLGNHDIEADASLEEIEFLEKSHPYSMFDGTTEIDPTSLSNYVLHIYSAFEKATNKVAALAWLFDSKKKCFDMSNGNGCIGETQLNWYEDMSNKHLNADGSKIEGMSFFHVPIREFVTVWNWGLTFGVKGESVCCPAYQTKVFQRFKKVGNMRAIVCGHDHNNNFAGKLEGIDLIFGQKTGYGSYGPSLTQRGGTVYTLKEKITPSGKVTFDYISHILFEDGSIQKPDQPRWQGFNQFQTHCNN